MSHFKVGQGVKCKASGMTGKVIEVDPKEKGKYYKVQRTDGSMKQYSPDELTALKESWDDERMDIIGQNGNDGLHYEIQEAAGDVDTDNRVVSATRKPTIQRGADGKPHVVMRPTHMKKIESKVPFDPPYKRVKSSVTVDKSGAKHGPMSKARHLSQLAMRDAEKKLKNVRKEKTEVDELNKSTMSRYTRAAARDISLQSIRGNTNKINKRVKGIDNATHKLAMRKESIHHDIDHTDPDFKYLLKKHKVTHTVVKKGPQSGYDSIKLHGDKKNVQHVSKVLRNPHLHQNEDLDLELYNLIAEEAFDEAIELFEKNEKEMKMASSQIEFIEYAAEEIEEWLESNDDTPEWFQNKLTKAFTLIEELHSYVEGDEEQGDDAEDMKEAYTGGPHDHAWVNKSDKLERARDRAKRMGDHKKHAELDAQIKQHYKRGPGVRESEEVNELSKQTLGNYIKKASRQRATASFASGQATKSDEIKTSLDQQRKAGQHDKQNIKRAAGINKAVNKLTKEDTQIDELSNDLLKRYDQGVEKKHRQPDGSTKYKSSNQSLKRLIGGLRSSKRQAGFKAPTDKVSKAQHLNKLIKNAEKKESVEYDLNEDAKVIAHLVKKGLNPKDAAASTKKHLPYVKKAYGNLSPAQAAAKVSIARANESVEKVDELSKNTLGSYIGKATDDKKGWRDVKKDFKAKGWKTGGFPDKKVAKRDVGIKKAASRLAKEDTQLDELSPATLNSYQKKATDSAGDNALSHPTDKKAQNILRKRFAGLKKANKRLGEDSYEKIRGNKNKGDDDFKPNESMASGEKNLQLDRERAAKAKLKPNDRTKIDAIRAMMRNANKN